MNARHIQSMAHLLQEDRLPVAARWRRKAIGQSVPAYDYDQHIGPAPQFFWKRAHIDVLAPERFEIAHDKCHDFIRAANLSAVWKHQAGLRIRSHARRINSFMNDLYLALIMPWNGRLLPICRRNSDIAVGERQQGCRILELQPDMTVPPGHRKFQIESDVASF